MYEYLENRRLKDTLEAVNEQLLDDWSKDVINEPKSTYKFLKMTPNWDEARLIKIPRVLTLKIRTKKRNAHYVRYSEVTMVLFKIEIEWICEEANENMSLEELKELSDYLVNKAAKDKVNYIDKRADEFLERVSEHMDKEVFIKLADEYKWMNYEVQSRVEEKAKKCA